MSATLELPALGTARSTQDREPPRPRLRALRPLLPVVAAVGVVAAAWLSLPGLELPARITLGAFGLAIVGWVMTDLDDTFVSLAAAALLVLAGVIAPGELFASMGDRTVWLLLSSFVVAAAVTGSGLSQRLVVRVVARARTVGQLCWLLTGMVMATAFVIPATSGRAALMVPIFSALAAGVGDRRVTRALALLFPTIILLSAVASLLGAGAHLVAAELIASLGGQRVGFARWLVLGLPFAICSCALASWVIQRLFLSAEERRRPCLPYAARAGSAGRLGDAARAPLSAAERRVALVLAALAALWLSGPLHGIDATVVAIAGALLVTAPGTGTVRFGDGLRSVQWPLLLFLAATLVLGEALISSGAAGRLVESGFAHVAPGPPRSMLAVVTIVAGVSLLSHLVITSRTARSAVLVPLVVLLAGSLRLDPTALAFLSTAAAGFCQTLPVSAKPVAMFSRLDAETYSPGDLLRLAAVLLPLHLALLISFAFTVWPALGLDLAP